MKISRAVILVLLAAVGYGALSILFPRFDPSAKWGFRIDRARAIARAQEVAAGLGLGATNWIAAVETSPVRQVESYLSSAPDPQIAALLSPVTTEVNLIQTGANRELTVVLANDGRLIRFVGPDSKSSQSSETQSLAKPAAGRVIAPEEALSQLAGAASGSFKLLDEKREGARRELTWKFQSPADERMTLEAKAAYEGERLTELRLESQPSTRFMDEMRRQRASSSWLAIGFPTILMVTVIIAIFFYLGGLVRKEVDHRLLLVLAGCLLVISLIWAVNSGLYDDIASSLGSNLRLQRYHLYAPLTLLLILVIVFFFSLPFLIYWAAGFIFSSRSPRNRLATIGLLLRGKFLNREVGSGLLYGLALGGLFSTLPYLFAALGRGGGQLRSPGYAFALVARWPLLTTPFERILIDGYVIGAIFGFTFPLLGYYLRRPQLNRFLILGLGTIGLAIPSLYQSSIWRTFAVAVVATALFIYFFERGGLLALITALLASDLAIKSAMLLAQPSPSLNRFGWAGWGLLGGVLIGSLALVWRGREVRLEEEFPQLVASNRLERERLLAEFDVARRAQERLLPDATPTVPGFEIAAVCRPAREVGGDLYDFIQFPDGRLGIVVADVSGKGVPASLYMTLTKGLLASVSENHDEPAAILREVNLHLYQASRKKIFVTLLYGILDPATRQFTYARAGHNPPVWWSAAEGKTRMLSAPGIGLGLNAGRLFDRTLQVEQIALEPRDLLILYSDGITEAMNERLEEYGEERLRMVASHSDGRRAESTRDALLKDVSAFLGRMAPQDDQTLIVVKAT
jgi:serine phosphatase RsbU (regulator of sigma subunit)